LRGTVGIPGLGLGKVCVEGRRFRHGSLRCGVAAAIPEVGSIFGAGALIGSTCLSHRTAGVEQALNKRKQTNHHAHKPILGE